MAQLMLKVKRAVKSNNTRDMVETLKSLKAAYRSMNINWSEYNTLMKELSKGL